MADYREVFARKGRGEHYDVPELKFRQTDAIDEDGYYLWHV